MGTDRGLVDTTLPKGIPEHERTGFGTLTKYDVFLNHRGPDLKKKFVSHLHEALRHSGCEPFLDAKALVKGQHAFVSINEALSGVQVHIAIFSPGYAESKYCLNELCDMRASEKLVIPVFYDIEPENLRWTDVGPFAEAFRKHLRKARDKDVVRWKAALLRAADITGFKLADCNIDEVNLKEEIVSAVLNALPALPPLSNARPLVGLKEPSETVINKLHEMGDNVGVVGICGVGGIGKTTLAREVYNHELSNFGSGCFLSDVKEFKGVAVMDLQKQIVADLLRVDARNMQWDSDRWFDQIRKHTEKVLLVVDDVSNKKQFEKLIPDLKELPRGSRVLITSREADILENITIDIPSVLYRVPELSFADSRDLFVCHAFRKSKIDSVDAAFHNFVKDIVRACSGLPLALEVMGAFLSSKRNLPDDERCWEEATLELQRNGNISSSLQISYDSLVEEDKHMFLDIACFMIGHPKRVAIEVWDSSGIYGSSSWSLSRLIDKCLVKVDDDGQLSMHDLLRDMGRNVVKREASYKPEMQSHIWDSVNAAKVLLKKQGSVEVLSMSVVGQKSGPACRADLYAKVKELRCLMLDGCPVSGDFSNWPEELRWLQWRNMPYEEFPLNLELPNLVVLDLAGSVCLTRVWARDFDLETSCMELRMLILNSCFKLRELPQLINKLAKLKFLSLAGCKSLSSIPDSLGDLTELEYLNLSRCLLLEYLPDSTVKLLKLREMLVEGCFWLKKLPEEIGRLKRLAVLCAAGSGLENLPESSGELQALKMLDLGYCRQLRTLSKTIGSLRSLRTLDMKGCVSLIRLPYSFSDLSNLQELQLERCKLLEGLPEDFGQLQSLKAANFEDCKHLQTRSADFGSLRSLQTLVIYDCNSLKRLPDSFSELSNLEKLMLYKCGLLERLPPSICNLKKLGVLHMGGSLIREVPEDFGQLQSLKYVSFTHCKHLQTLSNDFGSLGSLRTLDMGGCESLVKLPDSFSDLTNLEELQLHGCTLLERLPPSMGKLKMLRKLYLMGSLIREVPEDFGQLHNLKVVSFAHCKHLQTLSADFGSLRSLQTLVMDGCESLKRLPNTFSDLIDLEELWLRGCTLLEKLPPSIGKLRKLRVLSMGGSLIREVPEDFGQLQSLSHVHFAHCKQFATLSAYFGSRGRLQCLDKGCCECLTGLPDSSWNFLT